MQYKIREHFRGVPDEFMTSDVAVKAKVILICFNIIIFVYLYVSYNVFNGKYDKLNRNRFFLFFFQNMMFAG